MDTGKVATTLIQDPILVKDWQKFFHSLEISSDLEVQYQVPWEKSYNNNSLTVFELFNNILKLWESTKGSQGACLANLQETLVKTGFVSVAEQLEANPQYFASASGISLGTLNTTPLPQIPNNFTGRKAELEILQKYFDTNVSLVIITGLGGIGKTSLARKFVSSLTPSSSLPIPCLWFEGESPSTLRSSVVNLLPKNYEKYSTFEMFKELINKSQAQLVPNTKTIIVFDNVDQVSEEMTEILQFLNLLDTFFTIVTSRYLPVAHYSGEMLKLDVLCDSDAAEFIKKNVDMDNAMSVQDINAICIQLQNLPLALQQAVAYIRQEQISGFSSSSYGLKEYLEDLLGESSKKMKLLDHPLSPIEHGFIKTTFATWDVTIKKLKEIGTEGHFAIKLLQILSYLNPDGVRVDKVELILNPATFFTVPGENTLHQLPMKKLETALKTLKSYSMINSNTNTTSITVSIHRLVQEVTRMRIHSSPSQKQGPKVLNEVLRNIHYQLGTDVDDQRQEFMKDTLDLIIPLWSHGLQFDELVLKYSSIGVELSFHSDCPIEVIRKTRNKIVSLLPKSKVEVFTLKINFAWRLTLSCEENLAKEGLESLRSLVSVMSNDKSIGINDPETLRARDCFLRALRNNGMYEEYFGIMGEWLGSEVSVKSTWSLGKEAMRTIYEFGEICEKMGHYEDAISCFVCIIDWMKVRELESHFVWTKQSLLTQVQKCCEKLGISFCDNYSLHWELSSRDEEDENGNLVLIQNIQDEPIPFNFKKLLKHFEYKGTFSKLKGLLVFNKTMIREMGLDRLPHR